MVVIKAINRKGKEESYVLNTRKDALRVKKMFKYVKYTDIRIEKMRMDR